MGLQDVHLPPRAVFGGIIRFKDPESPGGILLGAAGFGGFFGVVGPVTCGMGQFQGSQQQETL